MLVAVTTRRCHIVASEKVSIAVNGKVGLTQVRQWQQEGAQVS